MSARVKHLPAIAVIWLVTAVSALTDTVVTKDGQRHEGALTLQAGGIQIGTTLVPIEDLHEITRDLKEAAAPKDELTRLTANLMAVGQPGALSWNGTLIAGRVTAIDDTKVSLENQSPQLFLSTDNTAAVFFTAMSYHQLDALRSRNAGVLLKGGDFFEGRLLGLKDGRVELESILFGRKSFAVGTEAEALWIRSPKVDPAAYTVHTRNGSVIVADSVALTSDGVEINHPPLRQYRIPLADLGQLRRGNATDIVTLAWNRIDKAKPEEKIVLLASVANVGRMLELRAQVARQQPALKLAQAKMDLVDKKRGDIRAANDAVRREYDQLRQVWSQRNADYMRVKSLARTKATQLRQKQAAVRRVRSEMDRWRRQVKQETTRLEDAAKALADAAENQLNAAKNRHDAARRQVDQSKRQLQRSEQRLAEEQKKVEAFQKTIQPAKDQERAAKEVVDAAYRAKEAAQDKQRKGLDAWREANKAYFDQLTVRNRLQAEYNKAVQELEQIQPAVSEPPR